MCKTFAVAVSVAFLTALSPHVRAGDSKPNAAPQLLVYDPASAFEFLKTLGGTWERTGGGHEHGGKSNMNLFRVSSAGSSVVETIFPGEHDEMITVYHMDGGKLLLTHYCALQNAPEMKFVKTNKPGEIKFEFAGGTNFNPKTDMHVHEGTLQIKDQNTIDTLFVVFDDGKPSSKIKSTLKRRHAQ